MPNFKALIIPISVIVLIGALAFPVFALEYNSGVKAGKYVKYGNFVGTGTGVESFNDYSWTKLEVTSVSGKEITLLSTGQFKDGTAIPGNGTTEIWNIETGTQNGVPSTQGPIIAANLNQGDAIPPLNTYAVNRTESRVYLGVSRTMDILDVTLSTPDYNSTLTYVYDRASGMLLESTTQTTTQALPQPVTTTISYSVIATNIFGSTSITPTPSPTVPEFPSQMLTFALLVILVITAGTLILLKKKYAAK